MDKFTKLENKEYTSLIDKNYKGTIHDNKEFIPDDVKKFMHDTQNQYTKKITFDNILKNGPLITVSLYENIRLCLDILFYFNNTIDLYLQPIIKQNINNRLNYLKLTNIK